MASIPTTYEKEDFLIVHPLDDVSEPKRSSEGLPPIAMTASVRASLYLLRAYLLVIMGMLVYHVLQIAGWTHHP